MMPTPITIVADCGENVIGEIAGSFPDQAINFVRDGKNVGLVKINDIESISGGMVVLKCGALIQYPVPILKIIIQQVMTLLEFQIVRKDMLTNEVPTTIGKFQDWLVRFAEFRRKARPYVTHD